MFTHFDTIHERDGQTDRRTPHDSIDACSLARLQSRRKTTPLLNPTAPPALPDVFQLSTMVPYNTIIIEWRTQYK